MLAALALKRVGRFCGLSVGWLLPLLPVSTKPAVFLLDVQTEAPQHYSLYVAFGIQGEWKQTALDMASTYDVNKAKILGNPS